MKIKILGTGCPNCKKLYKNTQKALKEKGVQAEIEKVEEIEDIMKYNIMKTPALVIDEEVKEAGKVLSPKQIAEYL